VCCSVLQCVALCCSVLQCVAVCCSLQHWLPHHVDDAHVRGQSLCRSRRDIQWTTPISCNAIRQYMYTYTGYLIMWITCTFVVILGGAGEKTVLKCVAECWSMLQCVAVCKDTNSTHIPCRTLSASLGIVQHTAETMQHTAAHCNTLQHTAIHCNTLQHYMNTQHALDAPLAIAQHTAPPYNNI